MPKNYTVTKTLFLRANSISRQYVGLLLSVLTLPIIISFLFALVIATFSLLKSLKNPIFPLSLLRTVEIMMISFSLP